MPQAHIIAAGAVIVRKSGDVLLVHRPKYDDWSFAKGKVERGEHIAGCAVREVLEETGLVVRLGRPLPVQQYPVGARIKVVHYWVGHVVGDDDVSHYVPNSEIDEVRWVRFKEADRLLTYAYDRQTLAGALDDSSRTRTLVVLRHATARPRAHWPADDRLRPLLADGEAQAVALGSLLAAYDVRRLVSSSSYRCVQTLVPYADATERPIDTEDVLSEEDATADGVRAIIDALRSSSTRTVVCTHRPVLPTVFAALDLDDPGLEPGQMCVVHHRKGHVVATEVHRTSG